MTVRLWYDSIRLSVWLPTPTHVRVWVVVGLGVDRIVDASRFITVLTPQPTRGVWCVGVLLFVSAY